MPESKDSEEFIRVAAKISRELNTRGDYPYIEEGKVYHGLYYLTYPSSATAFNLATVDFDDGEIAGTGWGIAGGQQGALTWNIINGSTPTFFMDNVSSSLNKNAKSITDVTFGSDNPYVAGLVNEMGSNDLHWGSTTAKKNDKYINFDMHHAMSKFKVQITVDDTNADDGSLDFTDAEVYITNLVFEPKSYNRLTGTVSLDENPVRNDMLIVNPSPEEPSDGTLAMQKIEWKEIQTFEGQPHVKVYVSQDFIVPPQGLPTDATRPKLVVKVHNNGREKVYSGYLPHAMEVMYEGMENPYPLTLSFLREHYLTIRTIVTKEPPQLIFMPVEVLEWVHKGYFTASGYQAGVYSEDDFFSLMDYYNKGNETMLARFGKKTKNGWDFNIFSNITLDYNNIFGQMKPDSPNKLPYKFFFSDFFKVYVLKDGTVEELSTKDGGPQRLYEITSGTAANP